VYVLLAGMGGVSRWALAAAVANAGGYGMLGMVRESPELITEEVITMRSGSVKSIMDATGKLQLEEEFIPPIHGNAKNVRWDFWSSSSTVTQVKPLILSCFLLGAFPVNSVAASEDLLVDSAGCGGRLSAQIDHERLIGSVKMRESIKTRSALFALMKAVSTESTIAEAHGIWIGSRQAQSALLKRAAYPRNEKDGALAAKRAAQLVAHCTRLVRGFLDARKNNIRATGILTGAINPGGSGDAEIKSYRFFSSFPK
jgi:NAD(P)H-dependent flavin oxidoreductase YrpB (nitropropane dioxygenase family)